MEPVLIFGDSSFYDIKISKTIKTLKLTFNELVRRSLKIIVNRYKNILDGIKHMDRYLNFR